VSGPAQPLRSFVTPLQPHRITHSAPLQRLQQTPVPTRFVHGPVQNIHSVQVAPEEAQLNPVDTLPPAPIAARDIFQQPLPLRSIVTPIQQQVHHFNTHPVFQQAPIQQQIHHFNTLPGFQQAPIQPAEVVQVAPVEAPLSQIETLPPAPIAARVVSGPAQPLRSFVTPLQPHTFTHSAPLQRLQQAPVPTRFVHGPVQPLASVFTPLQHNGITHLSHFTPIQQTQVLTPIQSQPIAPAVQPQAPAVEPQAPAVIAARVTPTAETVPFKSIPLEFGNPATIAPEVKAQAPPAAYGAPIPAYEESQSTTPATLLIPVPAPIDIPAPAPVPVAPQGVISAKVIKNAPVAVVKSDLLASRRSEPIAIVRSHANVPANSAVFDYSFESANGIKQEAVGSVRSVDDNDVSVMKGSYEYVGPDNVLYSVVWYADESGFHATAPHIPQSVVPNHPEVAAAVKAQLAFAAEQDSARRARPSEKVNSYVAPAPSYAAPTQEYLPAYE